MFPGELNGKLNDFSDMPSPCTWRAPLYSINTPPHQSGTFVTVNGPIWTYQHHLKSIVYVRVGGVHSIGFKQAINDNYSPLEYIE